MALLCRTSAVYAQGGFQTDTWNGGGGNGSWNNAANWNQAVSANGDDLVFTGIVGLVNSNNFTGLNLSSITLNGNAFNLSGNSLTITNNITDNVGSNTISIPLVLGANPNQNQTFANNSAYTNTYSGTIAFGTNTLTIGGSGASIFSGQFSSTNGGMLLINNSAFARIGSGSAEVAIGTNIADAIIINGGGVLQPVNAASLPAGNSTGNIQDNGTLDLNGVSPTVNGLEGSGIVDNLNPALTGLYNLTVGLASSNAVFSGIIQNNHGATLELTKTGFGTETLNGGNTYNGPTTINQGTLAVGFSGSLGLLSSNLVISPGAVLDVSAVGVNGYRPQFPLALSAGTPTKPYTNFFGSYNPVYPNFIITTNITATTTNMTTNSIVNVINYDVVGNFNLFGGAFTPVAPAPGYASFNVNGNVVMDNSLFLGPVYLNFLLNNVTNAGGGLNDLIAINGGLTLNDTINFVISPAAGSLNGTGKYTLVTTTGGISTAPDNNGGSSPTLNIIAPRGITGTLDTTSQPGNILLSASGTASPGNIVWAGLSNKFNWDIGVSQNWKNNGVADFFYSGDNVTFNDTGFGNVNLPTPLSPGSVTFNNNSTNYVFTASGASFLTGNGSLTLNGFGSVTLNNPNSYTGNTIINNGTLILGNYSGYGNTLIYNGVAPGQLIFGSGNGTLENNESIANASQSTTLAGVTLNSGANATLSSGSVRGSNDTGYMALGSNIVRNVGSSLYINFIIKGGVANNGVYFTNTIPWTNGLLLNAGWLHDGSDWLAAQTNFNNGNNPASGLYSYTGYSNNAALAVWLPTNNMSVSNSTFADTASATINSLKLSGPATVTITSGQALTIQNGGLLVSSAGVGSSAINGGTIKGAAGADLIVLQNLTGSANALTIGSVIADNGSPTALTLGGLGGTLILTNNNTYTGATYINNGSLQIGAGAAAGSIATSSSVLDNGFLSFNRPDATSVGFVSGRGGITQLGTGSLTLTANNTLSGAITISSGTLQLGTGSAAGSISNTASLLNSGKLVFDNSGTVGYPNPITGIGSLVQLGSGTLVVATNEPYTGSTTVSNGTLLVVAGGAVTNTSSYTVNSGATLDVSAIGGLNLRSAAPAQFVAGGGTVNGQISTANGTALYPGGINSIGTLTLNGNLTLNEGTYVFGFNGGSSNAKIVSSGTLGQNGGVVIVNNLGAAIPNGLYPLITAAGGLSGSVANVAVANFIQPGQIAVLTNSTANELDLLVVSGTEPTVLWSGDGSQNLWDTTASSFWLTPLGASSQYTNGDYVLFNDTGSVNPPVNLDAVVYPTSVTVNSTNDNYTFGSNSGSSGRISGGAALIKNGPGTLVLQTLNDYIGGTGINGGVVQLNGTGTGAEDGMVGIGGVTNNGVLIASNANPETIAGNITGTGALYQNGVGPLILAGNNTGYSGPVSISLSNTLQIGNAVSGTLGTGTITNNGTLVLSPGGAETAPAITGSGGITNLSGTTTLNGNDTYAGLTAIFGGTLRAGSAAALPTSTTVVLNNNATTAAGTLDLNGFNQSVTALVGTNFGNGTVGLNVSTILNNGSGTATLAIIGTTTNIFNGQIIDNNNAGTGKVALAIMNGANETLVSDVNAVPALAFPNTFSGGITVSNATLSLGAVVSTTPGTEGTAAVGGNPAGTQNLLFTGTNDVFNAADSGGSTTPTVSTTVGTITLAAGCNLLISGPQRGTFAATALVGSGNLRYHPNYVRNQCNIPGATFTGTVLFDGNGAGGGNLPLNSAQGFPLAAVFLATNNANTVDFCGTVSGNVLQFGSLSGGDNTFVIGGGTTPASEGSAPTIYQIGALNTNTMIGAQFIDGGVGIRKVGTGTLTLTNGVLSYGGQTVVSNGTLAIVPAVVSANLNALANANNFLVGSNFTLASPGILDISGDGGTLFLGHTSVQSLFGNGTLNGSLRVTNGTVAPGLRAAGGLNFFTGSQLTINGSVTLLAASTNLFSINRTNTVQNDSVTASGAITYGGLLLVTNLGDTAYAGGTSNVFRLFNKAGTGSFAQIVLPTLPAGEIWVTNLSLDGSIALVNTAPPINNNPPTLQSVISGSTLTLGWPTNLGWILQSQTNSLAVGLTTPTNNWIDISNSITATNAVITVNPANPTVFYRMRHP